MPSSDSVKFSEEQINTSIREIRDCRAKIANKAESIESLWNNKTRNSIDDETRVVFDKRMNEVHQFVLDVAKQIDSLVSTLEFLKESYLKRRQSYTGDSSRNDGFVSLSKKNF